VAVAPLHGAKGSLELEKSPCPLTQLRQQGNRKRRCEVALPTARQSELLKEETRIAMNTLDKNHPTHEWIEQLGRRFPCEKEINRVLSRKLRRRAGPAYSPVTLATLVSGVEMLLRKELANDFEVVEPKWLCGGASKLQMSFKLRWSQPGIGNTTTAMVLRMEPSESIVETSRLREFQLIKAFEGHVPVPPAYWVDREGAFLPYPSIIYGFARGVTKPSIAISCVSGLGTNLGPEVRPLLAPQFVKHLALIHTRDWRDANLSAFDVPALGTQAAEWQLNWWERLWEEDANEDIPLMRLAMVWLRGNLPSVERLSVVHGDYRTGNFLYTEEDNKISAWLDWELGHLGDRHEDIAWATNISFGHIAEDGKTFLIGGLMSEEVFFEEYEQVSGLPIDRKAVNFYRVMNAYKCAVIVIGSGYRVVRGGKTHQDVLVAWLMGVGYTILEELRKYLEEAI
jgi:aminoglycoside phosphotransferase (APT) family kinase protein